MTLEKHVRELVNGMEQMLIQKHYDEAEYLAKRALRQARRDTREEVAQLLEASEAEPDLYTRERRKELAATVRAMKED